jgi:glycosyltransferase involved in cell wall biosynthesis
MPVYGVERYIARAIESVLAQEFTDWELLVVNDGSSDRSREIAEAYANRDSRIVLLDKENGGLSDARNFGLERARGKYIHLFDSDDSIEADMYGRLIAEMGRGEDDFIIFGYTVDRCDADERIIDSMVNPCAEMRNPDPALYTGDLRRYMDFAWNKIYRAEFLTANNLRFTKGLSLIEDIDFMSRVFECKPQFAFTAYAGYHYMDRQRQTLSKCFDSNSITWSERRIPLQREIFESLGVPQSIIRQTMRSRAFDAYRYLLHMADMYSADRRDFAAALRQILASAPLRESFAGYRPRGAYDTAVTLGIRMRSTLLLQAVYSFKRHLKKQS